MNQIIIRRCAWHKKYFGQKKILSVVYHGQPGGTAENTEVVVTDGLCETCADKVLEELEKDNS